jgi:predicted DNA-binding protein YlxM (UPF0122 family)
LNLHPFLMSTFIKMFRGAGLTKKQIEALAWWLHDGHSLKEIATWQKCSRAMAQKRIQSAIKRLRAAGIEVPERPEIVRVREVCFTDIDMTDEEIAGKEADAI